MAKEFLYTALVAPQLSFDLQEIDWSAVSFLSQFHNEGTKESKRKLTADEVELDNPDHHLYMVMSIDNPLYEGISLGKELSQLNACKGFKECIDIDGEFFDFLPGTMIRVVGKSIEFQVNKDVAAPAPTTASSRRR